MASVAFLNSDDQRRKALRQGENSKGKFVVLGSQFITAHEENQVIEEMPLCELDLISFVNGPIF